MIIAVQEEIGREIPVIDNQVIAPQDQSAQALSELIPVPQIPIAQPQPQIQSDSVQLNPEVQAFSVEHQRQQSNDYYQLGREIHEQGDYSLAATKFNAAIQLNPLHKGAYHYRAACYHVNCPFFPTRDTAPKI